MTDTPQERSPSTDDDRDDARSAVRVGAVSYLNTLPLVEGLGGDGIELSFSVPSALARDTAAGHLDVALLPVIELARIPDLELIPGLGITTRGPSASVLLVSGVPLDAIRSVALDPESRTSNALVQVLFARAWGGRPAFATGPLDLATALADHDAAVRIGDKALFETVPDGCHVVDLGEAWTRLTGLPFVFAAWAARPGVVDRPLYLRFHDARRRGTRAVERISREYTWNGRTRPELVRDYLTAHIHYRLGTDEIRAVESFLRYSAELGLVDAPPTIRLAFQRWSACHEEAARRGLASRREKVPTR